MKSKRYLIDIAHLDNVSGTHSVDCFTSLYCAAPEMKWSYTCDTLEDALLIFDEVKTSPTAVAVSIAEWSCDGETDISTGNYRARHCSPRSMVNKIVRFSERPFSQRKYANGSGRFHKVAIGEWEDKSVAHITNYSVTGSNWLSWTPCTLSDKT